MPSVGICFFSSILLSGFRVNYRANTENDFCIFLVLKDVCLKVKYLKRVCNVCTKICDSVKNYVHHGKKQWHVF